MQKNARKQWKIPGRVVYPVVPKALGENIRNNAEKSTENQLLWKVGGKQNQKVDRIISNSFP